MSATKYKEPLTSSGALNQKKVSFLLPEPQTQNPISFNPADNFNADKVGIARNLLKEKRTLVFHGGGGKGRVLPAVFELLQAYGLNKTPERVVGISAGCFMALAVALKVTEKKDLLSHLKRLPFETFKTRTLKRTLRFFIRVLGALLPGWFGQRFQKSFDWAYYDSSGIREYVRKLMIAKFPDWQELEDQADYLQDEKIKKDPTFADLYAKTGVDLELHATVAEQPNTKVYSYTTTPNEKISLAFQASTSIPGVYPPVEMISGTRAVDGGFSDCAKNFSHIPESERLHIRLLDESASELYHHKPRHVELPTMESHMKRLLGLFYNFEYKYFPDSEKALSIAVEVPVATLHYAWTDEEQQAYDHFACAQTFEQLRQMVDLQIDQAHKKRLTQSNCIIRQYATETEMLGALEQEIKNPYVLHAFKLAPTHDRPYMVVFEVTPRLFDNQLKFS